MQTQSEGASVTAPSPCGGLDPSQLSISPSLYLMSLAGLQQPLSAESSAPSQRSGSSSQGAGVHVQVALAELVCQVRALPVPRAGGSDVTTGIHLGPDRQGEKGFPVTEGAGPG